MASIEMLPNVLTQHLKSQILKCRVTILRLKNEKGSQKFILDAAKNLVEDCTVDTYSTFWLCTYDNRHSQNTYVFHNTKRELREGRCPPVITVNILSHLVAMIITAQLIGQYGNKIVDFCGGLAAKP